MDSNLNAETFLKTTDHPRSYRDLSDLVAEILEQQKETTNFVKTGIIMHYSNVGKLDQAIRTFEQMKCEKSEKSFCALLTACLENSRFDLVHKYFESVPGEIGVLPGIVAHNLVMRAFIAEKKVDLARELFDKMESEKGLKLEVSSYNVMLTGYLKYGEDKKFDELYKEFMEKGLEPNLVTYNLKLSSLCKNMECVRAKRLIDEMVGKGVKPNVASFNTVIAGFCKIADFESAKSVLEKLCSEEDETVSPNSETYVTLIHHLVEEGEFELALEMCKKSLERKWVPPFFDMAGLVKGLSKENEAKEVVENMKKMLRGTAPDAWKKVEVLLRLL
ncbi:hypothetical protein ACHQM5_030847 [Ranunculus cassubicifolius]